MKPEKIKIISFGYFEKRYLQEILPEIEHEFSLPVIIREGHLDLSEFFDPARKQYDANKLYQLYFEMPQVISKFTMVNADTTTKEYSERGERMRHLVVKSVLLKEIETKFAPERKKTLGIFNVDLFIPILTFIYGQAFLNGRCGIASAYRLTNERYGLKADEKVFIARLRKEVIHELGHTFGLYHCTNPVCVMRSSTYVEDIDQKSWSFCAKCRKELGLRE